MEYSPSLAHDRMDGKPSLSPAADRSLSGGSRRTEEVDKDLRFDLEIACSFLNMVVEAPGPTDLTVSSELTY